LTEHKLHIILNGLKKILSQSCLGSRWFIAGKIFDYFLKQYSLIDVYLQKHYS